MAEGTVLLVDDSAIVRRVLAKVFADAGYTTLTAGSGEEALELLDRSTPDVVLTDIMMDGMDGYELCQRIRARAGLRTIPIIAVTDATELEAKLRGFQAGVDDFVGKDTAHAELLARVGVLLARQRASQAAPPPVALQRRRRQVVVFFGLKGGGGTSTLAVNTALLLARQRAETIGLLDLALQTGSTEVLLDVVPRVDLGSLAVDEVDLTAVPAAEIHRMVALHPNGVALLAAPRQPEDADRVTPDLAAAALDALADACGCVVVDTPNWFSEPTIRALDAANVVVLVITPDLVGAKAAAASVRLLRQLGVDEERLLLVLNAPYGPGPVTRKQLEDLLQTPLAVEVPYDAAFGQALNAGRPRALQDDRRPAPGLAALLELGKLVDERLALVEPRRSR
jgi:pilus assembly protein CpaE